MSNAYINKILFGVSNTDVRDLEPFMLTEEWYETHPEKAEEQKEEVVVPILEPVKFEKRTRLFWEIYC